MAQRKGSARSLAEPIQSIRKPTYFPGFLERLRMAEKALTAAVSIRSVDTWCRANGLSDCAGAVRHLHALFEIERTINGWDADERRAVRQEKQAASRGHARLVVAPTRNPLPLLRGPKA
ncbi:protein of unknown function [Bradyrhizobium vignae]|uniref:Uncharacterized protein n=1 Tax=Bradyrhizobium vignae TaxID=1549949 RepID=A0A2U3Q970_9BRAD|nr:protein of unknown function [Bradyrhizobium vignae]